ncbi:MAG TPA: AAA family ATPase, partial [Burkholderiaceae bacterium]|nr:AAA family ATPase [Burkholderiaceae bacterium]
MKIAVVSPSRNRLDELSRMLAGQPHQVALVQGGKQEMLTAAERESPDLILVEGECCNADGLNQVEYLTTHYPKTAVILLCPTNSPEFLLSAMRAGVREVLPSPVSAAALESSVRRIAAKLQGGHGKEPGKILAFVSCKGGSGATFLATNLGYQLAERHSVLLIDLNLQFGDALSFMHDGMPNTTLFDVAREMHRLDASFLAANTTRITPNYSLLAAPNELSDAIGVKPEHIDAILKLAAAQYDFILLDVGRALDPLTMKALDHAYRIFPVLQASLPSLRNAKKLLASFDSLGYARDRVELLVNRFDKRGEIGLADMQRFLGPVKLRTVQNAYKEVSTSINQGNPLIEIARSNPVAKSLAELARSLDPRPAQDGR